MTWKIDLEKLGIDPRKFEWMEVSKAVSSECGQETRIIADQMRFAGAILTVLGILSIVLIPSIPEPSLNKWRFLAGGGIAATGCLFLLFSILLKRGAKKDES
jgi:hypothetical protein